MKPLIRYRKLSGYKYELLETYFQDTGIRPAEYIVTRFIYLDPSGTLAIKGGYAWDGPSGPTIDTRNSLRASLVHDALYQLMREGFLGQEHRQRADEILRDTAAEDGMPKWRSSLWYYAVRLAAGRNAARSERVENPELVAP